MLENIMSAPIFIQITTIGIQLIAILFKIDHVRMILLNILKSPRKFRKSRRKIVAQN